MRPPNVNSHEMYRQDTAGQERFSSLSAAFFRGADAALLMFDVNRPETLDGLNKWWDEFKVRAPVPDEEAEDYCCVVVGNKVELNSNMQCRTRVNLFRVMGAYSHLLLLLAKSPNLNIC